MAESKTSNQNAEQLITEHLDIWTTAIEQKSSSGRGSSKKFSLHGIKKLRELILELAVRGKLVPQDPNDEPASVLLERIADEKAQLMKDKKIKKPKAQPLLSEDEKPFELPKGWESSNLNNLGQFQKGYAFKSKDYLESGFMITKIQTLTDNHIQNAVYIDPKSAEEFKQYLIFEGDIVMTTVGSWFSAPKSAVGRSFLINKQFDNSLLNQNAVRIRPYTGLNPMYLYLCINSSTFKSYLVKVAQGTANQASITQASIKSFEILLPPEKEQQRIVAKVEELMSLCDALEAQTENSITAHQTLVEVLLEALLKAPEQGVTPEQYSEQFQQNWQRLSEHFDTLFTTTASIDTLKQTILQLAVMGKLVPQNTNDEPAAKLLERIAAEKAQLIKDKKIKKQKPLPEITEEEKPFELPEGWEWSKLDNISILKGGFAYKSTMFVEGSNAQVIRMGNIRPDTFRFEANPVFISHELAEKTSEYEIISDDILLTMTGTNGKRDYLYSLVVSESDVKDKRLFLNQRLCISRMLNVDSRYTNVVLKDNRLLDAIYSKSTGTANQANIGMEAIKNWVIPIAPLEEQQRIVTKVDELMTLCDQLKARLTDAQTTKLHLTDAIVEQII